MKYNLKESRLPLYDFGYCQLSVPLHDVDEELRLCIKLTLVREALEPDLVEGLQKSHLLIIVCSPKLVSLSIHSMTNCV